jgi:hypothetical protein
VAGEPVLPDELAATVMRVDDLVRHFEEYPDPLVRGPAMELLQLIDGLHRGGLRRLADLLRAAGLQRRALDDPEARLLYELYDLDADAPAGSTPSSSGGSFVPLARLLTRDQPRG